MNFLAHFHIARVTQTSYAGALLGDMVKGAAHCSLSAELCLAIQLHRRIDSFTDTAPQLTSLHQSFAQGERRFVGIILDILFDHLLACRWSSYCEIELPQFAAGVYHQLQTAPQDIWPGFHPLAERMQRYQWLENYANPDALPLIFERLQQRLSKPVNLTKIAAPLIDNKAELIGIFDLFYPNLLNRSLLWVEELKQDQAQN